MALAYATRALGEDFGGLELPLLESVPKQSLEVVRKMIKQRVNSPLTTSLGRLFDAASALAAVAFRNTYEGQAPMELEGVARDDETGSYPYELTREGGMLVIDPDPLIRALAADVARGVAAGVVSARFHNAVIAFLAEAAGQLAAGLGVETVVLSGGCFQNQRLVEGVAGALEGAGLEVLTHSLVPANDGGLALGQAWVAAARLTAESKRSETKQYGE